MEYPELSPGVCEEINVQCVLLTFPLLHSAHMLKSAGKNLQAGAQDPAAR